jgi:hypothetical protein
MIKYAERFNWATPHAPVNTRELPPHPHIKPTSYMELSKLLDTAGCTRTEPMWIWNVCGLVSTVHGQFILGPGDWLVTLVNGVMVGMTNDEYVSLLATSATRNGHPLSAKEVAE